MKKLSSYLLLLSILISCETNEQIEIDLASLATELSAPHSSVDVNLMISSNNEILLMCKSNADLSHYDRALVSQHEIVPDLDDMRVKGAVVFESALLLNAGSTLLFIAVDNSENRSLLNQIRSKEVSSSIVPYWAYGLSTLRGEWSQNIQTKDGSAFAALLEYSQKGTNRGKVPPGGGGSENCTSGGEGSTSCSLTEVFGISCSVTCERGYYACCSSSTTTCKCIKQASKE